MVKFGEIDIDAKGWELNLFGLCIAVAAIIPLIIGLLLGITIKIEIKEDL